MNTVVALADPYGQANAFTGSDNLMGQWLGPLPSHGRMDPYETRAVDKWNFPDAYVGQNQYWGQTILDLLFLNNNFITQRIMPLRETNQLTQQWEQFEAMAHLLDTNPYQTPAHLLTQRRSIMRARLVHKNIMAEFEQNFLQTPMGRISFMAAMRQIENSVIQTAIAEGLRSLLNCHRYQEDFRRENMSISVHDIKDALKRDRDNFAIVQKVKNGMTKLDLDITKTMDSYGGVANAYLVPVEVSIYCTSVPSTATDYDKAGPLGPARINGLGPNTPGAAGTAKHAEPTYFVRNNDTYVVKDLRVEGVSREQSEILTRVRQIGEYVVMRYKPGMTQSKHRAIRMYDEDIDDMREIGPKDAIEHCHAFGEDGELRPVDTGNPNVRNIERQQDMFVYFREDRTTQVTEFLFQMSKEYLNVDVLLSAAKTLQTKYGNVYADPITTIGADNYLRRNISDINNYRTNRFPERRRTFPRKPQPMVENEKIGSAFLKTLIATGPASKQVELNTIASNVTDSVISRSEQIRDKIKQYVSEKVKGMRYPDTDKVDEYYGLNLKKYQDKIATEIPTTTEDSDISSAFPTRVEEFSVFSQVSSQIPQQQQRSAAHLEEHTGGVGLAEIGQFDWASGDNEGNLDSNLRTKLPGFDLYVSMIQGYLTDLNAKTNDPSLKNYAMALLMMRITKQNLLNLVASDVILPFNFLLLRPHQQYGTKTVIKCQQDGGTGFTFIGMANFQFQHEAGRMMALAHYSTHMRSVVMQPRNAFVIPDVMVVRCEGGAGCKFWKPEDYRNRSMDDHHITHSLISVIVPVTENEFPSPLDITGRFNTLYANQISGNRVYEPLHYSTAARFRELYQFGSNAAGTDEAAITGERSHNNTICYQGHQENYNPLSGKYEVITNKGHWGKNVYPGVRDEVRDGGKHELQNIDYMTSVSSAYQSY